MASPISFPVILYFLIISKNLGNIFSNALDNFPLDSTATFTADAVTSAA
jgi:hypothetical protein